MTKHITIATRESPLALRQAEMVKAALIKRHPQLVVQLLGITTEADKQLDVKLIEIGGKGLFVKELEEALYDGRADIAVHSMKDMPMMLPPGLIMPVTTEREDPRDAFVSNRYNDINELPTGAKVGTSSARRQTQLMALRPDITFSLLRGNINTRLKKLDHGEFDAIILASAGLSRMEMQHRISSYIAPEDCLPAAGQGALGIECREGDQETFALIQTLNHEKTASCVLAERAVCRKLNGGCKVPIAAFAILTSGKLQVRGLVANREGTEIIRAEAWGEMTDAENLGLSVAESLLEQGAEQILSTYRASP